MRHYPCISIISARFYVLLSWVKRYFHFQLHSFSKRLSYIDNNCSSSSSLLEWRMERIKFNYSNKKTYCSIEKTYYNGKKITMTLMSNTKSSMKWITRKLTEFLVICIYPFFLSEFSFTEHSRITEK